MKIPLIDLSIQYASIEKELNDAISSAIKEDIFVGGKAVNKFEEAFASYQQAAHCIGCGNGTDALEIALMALDIGQEDEVIMPAHTWISTAMAVSNVGAEPIFVDVLEDEFTIDPELIEGKITSKTKAIIPVHLYGLPARMDKIMSLAEKFGLKVIEDCAQAHGAEINGKKVGAFGNMGTFSFYPTKNLGAMGDGGAIICNDTRLAEKCRQFSNLGQLDKHDFKLIGRNSRLDTLQAAILSVKLRHLDNWIEQRIRFASKYSESLSAVQIPRVPNGYKHVFHLYVVKSNERDALKSRLREEGIETAIHYPQILPFTSPYKYKKCKTSEFPVSVMLSKEILSLPLYFGMKEETAEKLTATINLS